MKHNSAIPTTVSLLAAMLCAVTFSTSAATAEELALVEHGVSRAPIIVFEDAPPFTLRAADELAEYIERISGARPELIEGEPESVPDRAIWVGYQPALDALFPDQDFDFEHPEEILIAANDDHLVIAGRDRWNPDHLVVEGRNWTIEGVQQEYGTTNAVYTFLQDFLDVRWLWPGDLGIDVIERETIRFKPFTYRYHPQIRQRDELFRFSKQDTGLGHSHDWARFQRLQLDSVRRRVAGGHRFVHWWEKYQQEHPEYFALQPDGTRSAFPSQETVKLCVSNPGVWDRWLEEVEQQREADPNRVLFGSGQNDSWLSGHCVCESCRAWDHPDAERRRFRWQNVTRDYVAMSDRYLKFANKLAEMLEQRYPGEDVYVTYSAYGHARPAPIETKVRDNVIIVSVANFLMRPGQRDRGSPNGTLHRDQFLSWGEIADRVEFRPNIGNPAGWQQGMPSVQINRAIENVKFAAEYNASGIRPDTIWEHWATQAPLYYIMAQLTWNSRQDAQAVLQDYYRRGFGPAAAEIEAYWNVMQETAVAIVDGELDGWTDADEARSCSWISSHSPRRA